MSIQPINNTPENLPITQDDLLNIPQIAALTQKQQSVLYYMLIGLFDTDDLQTDNEIAKKANVDIKTVFNCRHNPQFNAVYTGMVKELTKSKTGILINRLFEQSRKSTKAAEILLKYSDQLIEKQQRLNANINVNTDTGNHLENLVSMLKSAGYTLDRLVNEITDIWNSL